MLFSLRCSMSHGLHLVRLAWHRCTSSPSRVQGRLSHAPLDSTCSIKNCCPTDIILVSTSLIQSAASHMQKSGLEDIGERLAPETGPCIGNVVKLIYYLLHHPFP
jgi:hypothetical protein